MSKKTEIITKSLKAKGYEPTTIDWQPIGGALIMSGPEGGWYIDFEPMEGYEPPEDLSDYTIMAYNISEVMETIEAMPVCVKENKDEQK